MKTAAITGATSMIGAALAAECVKNEIAVIAFVRKNSRKLDRLPDSPLVRLIEAELDDLGRLAHAQDPLPKADVFYHLGWATGHANRGNVRLQEDNIQYTLDAVDLAARMECRRFIGAGSQAEYGVPNETLTAETAAKPLTPYGISKLAAGALSRAACGQRGMEHIWIRVLSIYGGNDKPDTLISQLVRRARNNEPMELSGCEQTWDYLYESDAGRAFLETGRSGISGKTYVLGSGTGKVLRAYVDAVAAMVNESWQPEFGKKPYGAASPMHLQADIRELTEDTGWKPLVSFEEGIRRMLEKAEI